MGLSITYVLEGTNVQVCWKDICNRSSTPLFLVPDVIQLGKKPGEGSHGMGDPQAMLALAGFLGLCSVVIFYRMRPPQGQ